MKIPLIKFSLVVLILLNLTACDKDSATRPPQYVTFAIDADQRFYPGTDSIFSECEYVNAESHNFFFSKTYLWEPDDYFAFSVASRREYEVCPTSGINPQTMFFLRLTKKNEQGELVDFEQRFGKVAFIQKQLDAQLEVQGTFNGYFYQYYPVRPNGEVEVETEPLDSILIENGEFKLRLNL